MKCLPSTAIVTVCLLGLLTACSPQITTYQLEPVSGDVATIDGRQVTKAEQNGLGVVASFEREDLDYMALDVELQNHTDHIVDINPASFHFTALNDRQDTLHDLRNPQLILTGTAADPTYELGRMDYKRRLEEKRLKRAKVFNTVLMVALVASDVSSSSRSRNYTEYATNRITHNIGYQGLAVKRAVDYGTFANRMQQYDYEEYRWRELSLKAGTLAPGETRRGLVYVHKTPRAQYFSISYITPEQSGIPLLFRQAMVKQKKSARPQQPQ